MANARVTFKTVSKPTCCPSSTLANDLAFSVYLKRTFSPRLLNLLCRAVDERGPACGFRSGACAHPGAALAFHRRAASIMPACRL